MLDARPRTRPRSPAAVFAALAWLAVSAPGLAAELVVVDRAGAAEIRSAETDERRARIPTGPGPREVAVSPDGATLYVTSYGVGREFGTTLTRIDARRGEAQDTFELGKHGRLHGIAVSRDGATLWVTAERPNGLLEIDAATGAVRHAWRIDQVGTHMLVPSADESVIFASNRHSSSVFVIERDRGPVQRIGTGRGPEGLARSPDGQEIWVANRGANTLTVIDAEKREVAATLDSPGRGPVRLAFAPDGSEVWVASFESQTLDVFDAKTRRPIAQVDVGLGAEPGPAGLVIAPDGRRAFVSLPKQKRVVVVDIAARSVLRSFETSGEPDGLGWIP